MLDNYIEKKLSASSSVMFFCLILFLQKEKTENICMALITILSKNTVLTQMSTIVCIHTHSSFQATVNLCSDL